MPADMQDQEELSPEEFLASLPEAVQTRVTELKSLHEQYSGLQEECQKEIQAVEAKYAALFSTAWCPAADTAISGI